MNVNSNGVDDTLNGIPNLGPARRAALEAAGVTTRTALAQASVEQLVGMTGMARSLAEKTLEFVRYSAPALAAPPATDATLAPLAPADHDAEERAQPPEAFDAVTLPESAPGDFLPTAEDGDPGANAAAGLEWQILRAQTALSDLTRLVGDKADAPFSREAARLSDVLDTVAGPLGALKPKRLRRLAAEVEATAAQIEMLAQSEAKTGKKSQRRYTAILRDDRKVLEAKSEKLGKAAPPERKKTSARKKTSDGGKKPRKKK